MSILTKLLSTISLSDIIQLFNLIATFLILKYYYTYFTRPNQLPGPFPLPLIGSLHLLLPYHDNFPLFLSTLRPHYGQIFEVWLGFDRRIILSSTDGITPLLIPSQRSNFHTRVRECDGYRELGISGKGILMNHNIENWKYNRGFFSKAILSPSITKHAIEWSEKLAKECEEWWSRLGEDQVHDLAEISHRFSCEEIVGITMGRPGGFIQKYYERLIGKKESREEQAMNIDDDEIDFLYCLNEFMQALLWFLILPGFLRHYIPGMRQRNTNLLKNRDRFFNYFMNIITERRKEIATTPLDEPLRVDMLTSLLTANTERDVTTKDGGGNNNLESIYGRKIMKDGAAGYAGYEDGTRPLADNEVMANIWEAVGGGTDTTANEFSFMCYFLAHNPHAKSKLLAEIDSIFGTDLSTPPSITPEKLSQLIYCDAIIKETIRLIPAVPIIERINTDVEVVGGYEWPIDTNFMIDFNGIHRAPSCWGKTANEFLPDRFLESDDNLCGKDVRKLLNNLFMFGGGLRICPGRKLAIVELKCLLVLVFRKWDVELVDKESPLNIRFSIVNSCTELLVRFRPRKLD